MKKVRTIRIDKGVSDSLDSICERHGDVSWHIEKALTAYPPIKKSKRKPVGEAVKPVIAEKPILLIPSEINIEAWNEWASFRAGKRRPISDAAAKKQFKLLINYSPPDQQSIINQSIQNDYQGLFDLKGSANENNQRPVQQHKPRPSLIERVKANCSDSAGEQHDQGHRGPIRDIN